MAVWLATINVNSMAEQHKRAKIFGCLRTSRFDIFLIQETHLANMTQGKAWEKEWTGQTVWSPGSNRSAGVALLVHPNSTVKLVKLQYDNHLFQIINVYAPNIHSEGEQFFDSLWRFKFPNFDTIAV